MRVLNRVKDKNIDCIYAFFLAVVAAPSSMPTPQRATERADIRVTAGVVREYEIGALSDCASFVDGVTRAREQRC